MQDAPLCVQPWMIYWYQPNLDVFDSLTPVKVTVPDQLRRRGFRWIRLKEFIGYPLISGSKALIGELYTSFPAPSTPVMDNVLDIERWTTFPVTSSCNLDAPVIINAHLSKSSWIKLENFDNWPEQIETKFKTAPGASDSTSSAYFRVVFELVNSYEYPSIV